MHINKCWNLFHFFQPSQAALAEAAAVISYKMDWVIKQDYRLLQRSYISHEWIKMHFMLYKSVVNYLRGDAMVTIIYLRFWSGCYYVTISKILRLFIQM